LPRSRNGTTMKSTLIALLFVASAATAADQPQFSAEEVVLRQSAALQELSMQHSALLTRAMQLAGENAALQARVREPEKKNPAEAPRARAPQ
jgi:hypothetical protein